MISTKKMTVWKTSVTFVVRGQCWLLPLTNRQQSRLESQTTKSLSHRGQIQWSQQSSRFSPIERKKSYKSNRPWLLWWVKQTSASARTHWSVHRQCPADSLENQGLGHRSNTRNFFSVGIRASHIWYKKKANSSVTTVKKIWIICTSSSFWNKSSRWSKATLPKMPPKTAPPETQRTICQLILRPLANCLAVETSDMVNTATVE